MTDVSGVAFGSAAEFSSRWLAMINFRSGGISVSDMSSFSALEIRADVACNSSVGQGGSQRCRHRWRDNSCEKKQPWRVAGSVVARNVLVNYSNVGVIRSALNSEACEKGSRVHERKPS